MQYFNIQVASQLSGVASATIRAWEKRYNAVMPERADNKHRLYSEKDIEKLAVLYKLTEIGQSIGKIAHLGLDELKLVYASVMQRPYDELQLISAHHEKIDFQQILKNLYLATEALKLDIVSHELSKARSILKPREFCLSVLIPLMEECKNLSVVQKNSLASIVSFQVGQSIGEHYQKGHIKEDTILIASSNDDFEMIEALAAALLCVHHKIKFFFLGNKSKIETLSAVANEMKCRAILLTVGNGEILEFLNGLSSELIVNSEILVRGHVKESVKLELKKRRISYFDSFTTLDSYLFKFNYSH